MIIREEVEYLGEADQSVRRKNSPVLPLSLPSSFWDRASFRSSYGLWWLLRSTLVLKPFVSSLKLCWWNFWKQLQASKHNGASHLLHCRVVRLRTPWTSLQYTQSLPFAILSDLCSIVVSHFLPATDWWRDTSIRQSCLTKVSRKVKWLILSFASGCNSL